MDLERPNLKLLTDLECRKLIMSLGYARKDEGFNEEECAQIMTWANQARMYNTMLDLILKGELLINIKEGEVCFMHCGKMLTKVQQAELKNILALVEQLPEESDPWPLKQERQNDQTTTTENMVELLKGEEKTI